MITPEMKKSESPVVILNVDTIQDHSYLMMNPSAEGVFGMYISFLPLAVRSASSLIKGIRLYSDPHRDLSTNPTSVTGVCYSRIGLIGNPSDGYFGNTISISVDNYSTKVVLLKSDQLNIIPHPMSSSAIDITRRSDPMKFDSIKDLNSLLQKNGYTVQIHLEFHFVGRHSFDLCCIESVL